MGNLLYVDLSSLGLWDERFRDLLEGAGAEGTRVTVRHLEGAEGPVGPYLPGRPELYYAPLLREVGSAQQEGYDAVMLGCASEPGLRDAANASRIPVIGPFGAALHMAGLLGRRLGVLCPSELGRRSRPLSWHEQTIRLYGMAESRVSFRLVDIRRPEPSFVEECMRSQALDELRRVIVERYRESIEGCGVEQARRAVEEDRAEVLFFACTLWSGLLGPVGEAVDVPVLDAAVTLLKTTEAAVAAAQSARPAQRRANAKKGGIRR